MVHVTGEKVMDADNVISMVDDFNLAATVKEIKDFEDFLTNEKIIPRWCYIVADNVTGGYIRGANKPYRPVLATMSRLFINELKEGDIEKYDLEAAHQLCEKLNEKMVLGTEKKPQFTPIGWRRYCIIHLASLYDVIQKMDAKGKTKRFFASC